MVPLNFFQYVTSNINEVKSESWLKHVACTQRLTLLSPSIKLHILLLCFHTFLTEVVGRSS